MYEDRRLLWQTFAEESLEAFGQIEMDLLLLEQSPGNREYVERIFRSMHTFKGNALLCGFEELGSIAHGFEELLEEVQKGHLGVGALLISLLLDSLSVFQESLPLLFAHPDQPIPKLTALHERLRQFQATGSIESSVTALEDVAQASESSSSPQRLRRNTLRVQVDKLNQLMDLTGEMGILRSRMSRLLEQEEQNPDSLLLESHEAMGQLLQTLRSLVGTMRLVPLEVLFQRCQGIVRQTALEANKDVELKTIGSGVEVDMTIVENLDAPLVHLLRNAVGHGIESPHERLRLGKPNPGVIELEARHEGELVLLRVADDGRGIHAQQVFEAALKKGIIPGGTQLERQEKLELIFEPGLSTAASVTEMSGRGIGMHVIRKKVEDLRGNLKVRSQEGQGTEFILQLPLHISILTGFGFGIEDEVYIVPMGFVEECQDFETQRGEQVESFNLLELGGRMIPFVRLRELLQLPAASSGQREKLVVLHSQSQRLALVVDHLIGEMQVTFKPLDKLLKAHPLISGGTILGSGKIGWILDIHSLFTRKEKSLVS